MILWATNWFTYVEKFKWALFEAPIGFSWAWGILHIVCGIFENLNFMDLSSEDKKPNLRFIEAKDIVYSVQCDTYNNPQYERNY